MAPRAKSLSPHIPTVIAIAATAFVVTAFVYWFAESLACGAKCRAGEALVPAEIAASHAKISAAEFRIVRAAGTLGQVLLAALAYLLILFTREARTGFRYFLWLTLTMSGFSAGAYMALSLLFDRGDWGWFVLGLEPYVFWKVFLTGVGVGLIAGTYLLAKRPLEVFLGRTSERLTLLKTLTLTPLATALGIAVLYQWWEPGPAACFLLTPLGAVLLTLPLLVFPWRSKLPVATTPHKASPLPFSAPWLVAAFASLALFVSAVARQN